MKLSRSPACEHCGKSRGNHTDHSECSRKLQAKGAKKERLKHEKYNLKKMERQLAYYLEDRNETPEYTELPKYQSIIGRFERFKSSGQG